MTRKRVTVNAVIAAAILVGGLIYNVPYVLRIHAMRAADARAVEICTAECRMDRSTAETLILASDGSDEGNERVRALIDGYMQDNEHREVCRPCVDAILEAAKAAAP